tara:strand:- start:1319 stop:1885 length:567 start_codon:yes stop_codon:yes gene_type:complete
MSEEAVSEDLGQEDSSPQTQDAVSSGQLLGISIAGKLVGLAVMAWLISESYYAFTFFVLAMIPAFLYAGIDRRPGRFASKTVMACNFSGVLPYLFEIGRNYDLSIAAQQLIKDVFVWLQIYGFAFVGIMMIWVFPQIMHIFFRLRADIKKMHLNNRQEVLLDEFGENLKTGRVRTWRKTLMVEPSSNS